MQAAADSFTSPGEMLSHAYLCCGGISDGTGPWGCWFPLTKEVDASVDF